MKLPTAILIYLNLLALGFAAWEIASVQSAGLDSEHAPFPLILCQII